MDEFIQATKKELINFQPIVQAKYVQMKQLDSIVDTEWTTLLATQLEESNVTATHEFVVGASILARKW